MKATYEWNRKEFKLNLHYLLNTNSVCIKDISVEFGLKRYGVVILKKEKLVKFDGIHLPNQEIMKGVDENGYTYLSILEMDKIKEHKIKIKVTAEYKRRFRLILKSKFNSKNKIQAINTCAVALLRYGAGITNWKVDELKKLDRTMRKTLTMYGALFPKSDIDLLYLKRKHGRRGLISIEMCVRLKENNLCLYVRGSNEMLLKDVKKVGIVKAENLMEKEDFNKNSQNEFKNKCYEKRMYEQFVCEMPEEIDKYLSWKWLVQSDLKYKLKQRCLLHKNKH